MTDDSQPSTPPAGNGKGPTRANKPSANKPAVRSGLAHRRNPVLATLGDIAATARRVMLRDPLSLFLLIASIGLGIAFATLLGDIKPSSYGRAVPLSTVQTLAQHRDL